MESYLMYHAGSWEPRYDLQLSNDTLKISAKAIVKNNGGEKGACEWAFLG